MKGTGRLYWRVATGDDRGLIPDPTFGFILGDKVNPGTNQPFSITIVDEDKELNPNDVDLTASHSGTSVEFNARKIPGHEVYHCVDVKLSTTPTADTAKSIVAPPAREGVMNVLQIANPEPHNSQPRERLGIAGLVVETGKPTSSINPLKAIFCDPGNLPELASTGPVPVTFATAVGSQFVVRAKQKA